jgi:hypothetical protein
MLVVEKEKSSKVWRSFVVMLSVLKAHFLLHFSLSRLDVNIDLIVFESCVWEDDEVFDKPNWKKWLRDKVSLFDLIYFFRCFEWEAGVTVFQVFLISMTSKLTRTQQRWLLHELFLTLLLSWPSFQSLSLFFISWFRVEMKNSTNQQRSQREIKRSHEKTLNECHWIWYPTETSTHQTSIRVQEEVRTKTLRLLSVFLRNPRHSW